MQWKQKFFLPGQHDSFRREVRAIQDRLLDLRNQVWTTYEPSSKAGRAINALYESKLFAGVHKAMDDLREREAKSRRK